MNKVLVFSISAFLLISAGCKQRDYDIKEPTPDPVAGSAEDSCMSIVARNFDFRRGKWLEIQKPRDAQLFGPDTLWFKEDSLIGMSWQGDPYVFAKMYFGRCNMLYHKGWAPPQDTTRYGYWYMEYDRPLDQMTLIAYLYPKNDTMVMRRFSR